MNPAFIKQTQHYSIRLLKSFSVSDKSSLQYLSQDTCSETSRLVGCWLINKYPQTSAMILRGDKVMGSNKSHDVLVVKYNDFFYLLDPTVWQFFPRKKSSFLGVSESIPHCLEILYASYKGRWIISETISKRSCSPRKITALKATIENTLVS